MSKIGTKLCALSSQPERYLSDFGETQTLTEKDIALAEKFLDKCRSGARSTSSCVTFDELRIERYTSGISYPKCSRS